MKRGRRQTPLSSQVPKERNRIAHLRVRRTVARDEMTSAWIHRFARALHLVRPARPLPVPVGSVSSLPGGPTRTVRSARGRDHEGSRPA